MSQNTSTAVMQRRTEAHDSLDDFPTPPWATRALCRELILKGHNDLEYKIVREPCANRGFMVRPLTEYFESVIASDVHDYGFGFPVEDYLFGLPPRETDWTFMNPPFRLAEEFIARALVSSITGVCCLVRLAFVESIGRYERIWSRNPPTEIYQFVERVPMVKGRYDPEADSATAYCWLVWDKTSDSYGMDPTFHWIPPGQAKALFVPGDDDLASYELEAAE